MGFGIRLTKYCRSPIVSFKHIYKRNQVEEAVTRVFAGHPKRAPRSPTRALRDYSVLIATSAASRAQRMLRGANFAFFSDEGPGRGADISFSEYEFVCAFKMHYG